MGYAFMPTPVQISLVNARSEPGVVRLSWYSSAGAGFSGTVWRSEPGGDWASIGDVVADGTSRIEYADREVRSDAPATLELLDVSGRRLLARAVGALGAGSHVLTLEGGGIRAGTYFIRLTQGARSATRRAVVTR